MVKLNLKLLITLFLFMLPLFFYCAMYTKFINIKTRLFKSSGSFYDKSIEISLTVIVFFLHTVENHRKIIMPTKHILEHFLSTAITLTNKNEDIERNIFSYTIFPYVKSKNLNL